VRVHVDADVCDLHGQCILAAPEIFRFDDAGDLEYVADVAPELEAKVQSAVGICPTGAIELTG
jgi:ferredoxin